MITVIQNNNLPRVALPVLFRRFSGGQGGAALFSGGEGTGGREAEGGSQL